MFIDGSSGGYKIEVKEEMNFRRMLLGAGLFLTQIIGLSKSASADTVIQTDELIERNSKLDALFAKSMPEIKAHWKSCREAGLEAMTLTATNAVDAEVAIYFSRLKLLAINAADAELLSEMKRLYKKLNKLNAASDFGLLETDERELLVDIFIKAVEVVGIDSEKYDGEPGEEYRDF